MSGKFMIWLKFVHFNRHHSRSFITYLTSNYCNFQQYPLGDDDYVNFAYNYQHYTSSSSSTSSQTQTTTSTSSSTTSSLSSSSTPITTSTSSTTSTSATPTLSPVTTTDSGGSVITSYSYVTPTVTTTSSNNTATSSNSFFSNTGAVAGTFAEAAAEAAATSHSPFDDYTYSNNGGAGGGGGGGGGYPYSDTTHGTFVQAPMGLPIDTYGMSEMSQYDPYAAGAVSLATAGNVGRARSRQDSETQRAPGIAGVGAGNLAREPSRRNPYNAFAGPGPQPHETMDRNASMRFRPRGTDILEAAGLAGTGAAAMAGANNGAFINRRPSEYTQQTHGSMRSQGHPSNENYPMALQPAYHSPPRNDSQFADAYTGFVSNPPPQSPGLPFPNPHEAPPAQSHNPLEGEDFHDDAPRRLSYDDDNDYGQHNRVLRVANEYYTGLASLFLFLKAHVGQGTANCRSGREQRIFRPELLTELHRRKYVNTGVFL
ncbi:uncharacterized protein EDB91DRAFT_1087793 [Suillus paluster]|uniref:uncharacterized protein n=1 Tax=Suillus paluster TaxID=48578 RepID=UPI001B873DD4|nr:uncharacterized protein EDB91DRAFT_1087793 [Suillus paluster]KAG1723472.1 hypothetical protein EDB91DRAFT_1087793 [Suillus paluster]